MIDKEKIESNRSGQNSSQERVNNPGQTDNSILRVLKSIWVGKSTKKEYMTYLISVFSIYVFGVIYSASVFPGGFSFTDVYVSYLGGYPNNPDGYIVYNICVIISGILFVPHFIYIYKRITPTIKFLAFVACLFGLIGCLGFSSLGVYHQGTAGEGHKITTYLAFGGFGISAILMMFVLIQKLILKEEWPTIKSFLIVYGLIYFFLGFVLTFDMFPEAMLNFGIDAEVLGDRFLEWFYLLIVVIYLFGIVLMT